MARTISSGVEQREEGPSQRPARSDAQSRATFHKPPAAASHNLTKCNRDQDACATTHNETKPGPPAFDLSEFPLQHAVVPRQHYAGPAASGVMAMCPIRQRSLRPLRNHQGSAAPRKNAGDESIPQPSRSSTRPTSWSSRTRHAAVQGMFRQKLSEPRRGQSRSPSRLPRYRQVIDEPASSEDDETGDDLYQVEASTSHAVG